MRALVEYDGADYYGFQRLTGKPSVQATLESALQRLTGDASTLRFAGRTDAGVHASGQVIAADVRWRHSVSDLERAWNAHLPADVAVRAVAEITEPDFHPRFSARSRVYRYTLWTAPWRSPLHARTSHHVPAALDLERMNEAAAALLGRHDFASFGRPPQDGATNTVREVLRAEWQRQGWIVQFELEANAFLRRMVRTVTGTLLAVGQGHRPPQVIGQLLAHPDRKAAASPAPACGLCLVEVKY